MGDFGIAKASPLDCFAEGTSIVDVVAKSNRCWRAPLLLRKRRLGRRGPHSLLYNITLQVPFTLVVLNI